MHNQVLKTIPLADGKSHIAVRRASLMDARRIQMLYTEIYGTSYPVPTIYDLQKLRKAITDPEVYWLVGVHNDRIIASLYYVMDDGQKMAKAGGAVVSNDYRKLNLANTLMSFIQSDIKGKVEIMYSATRTVSVAPQYLADNLGFTPLGIFPNAHRVFENETHTLNAFFEESAWELRDPNVKLIKELHPLFKLANSALNKRGFNMPPAKIVAMELEEFDTAVFQKFIDFEKIEAPNFVLNRFKQTTQTPDLTLNIPFHTPNIMLVSEDQKTEVFLHQEGLDKYTVIVGVKTDVQDFTYLLNSVARFLGNNNSNYVELLVSAYSPELQIQALNARFLPSAYFPAMTKIGAARYDQIVFTRSFDMLDFRNVALISDYRDYLKYYLQLWSSLYVDKALKDD